MICYVVCAEVPWDSYHQCIMTTLDKQEADKTVNAFNAKHDPECKAYLPGGSDWDECFCKRYHMHEMDLRGTSGKLVTSRMSDLPQGTVVRPKGDDTRIFVSVT